MNVALLEFDFNPSWPTPTGNPESWVYTHIHRAMRGAYTLWLITLLPLSYSLFLR